MTTNPPDDTPKPFRARFSRGHGARAQTSGGQLLARGLRTLDSKAGNTTNRALRVARGQLSPSPKSAIKAAIRAAARGGAKAASRRFRNPRGAGVRGAGKHAQRVVIKARVMPTRGKSPAAAMRKHLAYIERDGVNREGGPGRLFDATGELDRSEVEAFADRGVSCRHQFRFIASPERGGDLDLERFTRDLMRRMEHDVGSRLDYVACAHHDTDQPHVHIVLNGRDERGGDLVISRDYIGNGMRSRAMELATNTLGYRTDLDVLQSLARDVEADRFTALHRRLQTLAERDPKGRIDLRVTPSDPRAALQRRLYLGRLAHLRDMGLAGEVVRGVWRIEPDAIDRLRSHTQHRAIQQQVERHVEPGDRTGPVQIIDKAQLSIPITGRVLGRGLANELSGTHYLVVSGIDGKTYYTALSSHSERHLAQSVRRGDIVTLSRVISSPTGQADRNIVALAQRHEGIYDPRRHLAEIRETRLPHGATPERFVEAHVRRLEGLASRGIVMVESDGRYRVPLDLIERLEVDPAAARDSAFVKVERCGRDLPVQSDARAFTWLDEQLVAGVPQQVRRVAVRNRFQNELIDAADQRARRLVQLGFATFDGEGLRLDPDLRGKLARLERDGAAARLSQQFGTYIELADTLRFNGRVTAIESLTNGPHAVVVSGKQFTLVPAERGLATLVGKDISLSMADSRGRESEQAPIRFRVLDAMDLSPSLGPSLGR